MSTVDSISLAANNNETAKQNYCSSSNSSLISKRSAHSTGQQSSRRFVELRTNESENVINKRETNQDKINNMMPCTSSSNWCQDVGNICDDYNVEQRRVVSPSLRRTQILGSVSSSSLDNATTTTTTGTSSMANVFKQRQRSGSKLRRATRAILLFRRQDPVRRQTSDSTDELSVLGACRTASSGGSTSRHTPIGKVQQLAASFGSFWRQNTLNETGPSSSGSPTGDQQQQHKRLRKSKWAQQLTGSKSSNQIGECADLQQNNSGSNSSICLPRFIVPKTNALKLPIVCRVRSLNGELMREIFVHRYELGQYLIDNLKVSLDIKDAKYFGLKLAISPDDQDNLKQPWLDLNESVCKQISKTGCLISATNNYSALGGAQSNLSNISNPTTTTTNPMPSDNTNSKQRTTANLKSVDFYLRIKYYPPNLARVQDPFLRQYLFLQLRRDLRLGKLTSSMNNLSQLMACVLQYELGDYKPELVSDRLSGMIILPNQDMIEQQAISIWQQRLVGLKRHQVQMQFLRASVILETYGFDYYPVRDHQLKRGYLLGFNYAGVKTIRNGRIVHHFRWHSISKIDYERRMIILHIYPNENSKRKGTLGFKCLSNEECQNLYMRLLEQKYFFTVDLAYFDKSIRRPSYLTESSITNEQASMEIEQQQQKWPRSDWSTAGVGQRENNIAEQQQQKQQQQQNFDNLRQQSSEDSTARCFAASEHDGTNLTSSFEDSIMHNQNTTGYCSESANSLQRLVRQRNFVDASQQSNSLDIDIEPPAHGENISVRPKPIVSSASYSDDCPDCKRAQQQQQQSSRPSSATVIGQKFQIKPGSLHENQLESDQQQVLADCWAPSAPLTRRLNIDSASRRASLKRQRSTSTNSPILAPDASLAVSSFIIRPPNGQQQTENEQAIVDESNFYATRLVDWIEWLFVQPMHTRCWPMATIDTHYLSLKYFVSQALRFCLLVVALNFLVRFSDLISSYLLDMLTFGAPTEHRDQSRTSTAASHCIWSSDSVT